MRKIYAASSWRNKALVNSTVALLRSFGHEVFDFTETMPFQYADVDIDWQSWEPETYRASFGTEYVHAAYKKDMDALDWCDTVLLLLPCGRSAHLEAGYACGQSKTVDALIIDKQEPELMYGMFDNIYVTIAELVHAYTN